MRGSKSVDIVAAVYPSKDNAKVIQDMLKSMHGAATISLVDSALVTKNEHGKVNIEETHEVTTRKGALRGALVMGVFGVIYPPSLLGSLGVGGALGGLVGRLRDTGIKLPQLEAIGAELTPGKAAVVALVDSQFTDQTRKAMNSYGGKVLVQTLDDDHVNVLLEGAGDIQSDITE